LNLGLGLGFRLPCIVNSHRNQVIAGTRTQAILDALKNPVKIISCADKQGRPFQEFIGKAAEAVV